MKEREAKVYKVSIYLMIKREKRKAGAPFGHVKLDDERISKWGH